MEEDSLFFLRGNGEILRNGDVHYPFRQHSDMLLLTGVSSPDIALVGVKQWGNTIWTIYSDPISDHEKLWGSGRMDYKEIRNISWIDNIRPLEVLKKDIKKYTQEAKTIYIRESRGFPKEKILSPEILLKSLRMIKLSEEIEKICEAIRVTKIAHDYIRTIMKPWMYEYEVEAEIARIFRAHHMTEAYPSIVASSANACTLHYTRHDRRIEAWDLILVDAGAEYEGYAADITRVFPVWEISLRQKEVYDSVIVVKEYAESLIRPWVKKIEYEKMVRERMNLELEKLWLIPANTSRKELEVLSRKYYPHSTSHFLGLDVHDTWERDEVFEAGMVITCEPGIYISEEGIGIRLEDDILIMKNGWENLSTEIVL